MTAWDDGYVTDVVYTHWSYRETMPPWLAITALMLGYRPPDLSQPFRFADLGCGHGLTATIVAATCPHADVWAFDFNPAHIESARHLASLAGLTNVHFREASFAELAASPPVDPGSGDFPGSFDFIVSHGVMSWISAENRSQLVRIIGQWLRPGGLAYLSYNVSTGWAAMLPVRALMRMVMRQSQERTDKSVAGVLDYLDTLKDAGAAFFGANPMVGARLAEVRKQDPRYVAHEFLNADWAPLMFADVAPAMESVKCSYIGSATLTENIDPVSVLPAVTSLLAKASDPILRETLRDFSGAKGFRRDVYRHGGMTAPVPEQVRLLDTVELVWSGRQPEDPIKLPAPIGEVQGGPEVFGPLMAMLMAGNCTIGAIRRDAAFATRPAIELLQAVVLLISSGYAHPALPEAVRSSARAGTDRLNAAIGAMNADGGNISRLAAATIGTDVISDPLETLVVREKLSGRSMEIDELTDRVLAVLTQAGRLVHRGGKAVEDSVQARAILRETLQEMTGQRLVSLQRLGVISP